MKTIAKNTKQFNKIINLKNWSMINDYYGFVVCQQVENAPFVDRIKKVQIIGDKYVITVSPNIWYEKQIN
jgi:hypothetical protein